MNPVINTRYWR